MKSIIKSLQYSTELPYGSHWSLTMRRHTFMKLNVTNPANVGMLFYNPDNLFERYNAPDTLKCQHTFKLTKGHCLYSDMGRIFTSVVTDSFGWHDTVCGNSHAHHVSERWGARDYQHHLNDWNQNGYDAFCVELEKYGLKAADMAANINWFSQVTTDQYGALSLQKPPSTSAEVILRFEMDTLVILHTCPHPLNTESEYPKGQVKIELGKAYPATEDDFCRTSCEQNQRGFENNALYYLGL